MEPSVLNRDEIVRRFERWLDETLSVEEPPDGIDADLLRLVTADETGPVGSDDAYALWAAMTALTQEVKLQGRAFRDLHAAIGAEAGRAADEGRAASRAREREVERDAERRCRRDMLGALIDLADRLSRGLETVRAADADLRRPGLRSWLRRRLTGALDGGTAGTLAALVTGYELAIERLDQALRDLNAHEIGCDGQAFDPRRMNAVDREATSLVPEGTVLEVYRRGYEWGGEVFRPAQVKVSCAPARGDGDE